MHRCLRWLWVSSVVWGAGAVAGCGAGGAPYPDPEALGDARQADRIAYFERPESLIAGASRRLADVIDASDVGRDFGVPDGRVPYADSYWPFVLGGSDTRWNPRGIDPRTPLEKYMLLTNPWQIEDAKMWELFRHGPGEPGVEPWHGHCPGWTAAAIWNAPVLHPVLARVDGSGRIVGCQDGERGCIRFEIGDVNALMAEVYLDGPHSRIGTTCDVPPAFIPRDMYGRVLKEGCSGLNAGSFLVVVSTLLKQHHQALAIDLQKPAKTEEIWNQPAYHYKVYDYRPITAAEAANLVERSTTAGPEKVYWWDRAARGFAFVDLGLWFVGEKGPNVTLVSGADSAFELRVAAVIELDRDPADPDATIVGGEYLDLPSSQAARLRVTPFVWMSGGPGPEVLPMDVGGDHHNPFVRPSLVQALVTLGQQQER
jgi:hypothetical protein